MAPINKNINLTNVESTLNKTEDIAGNSTSTTLYSSVKGIFDWVTNLLSSKQDTLVSGLNIKTVNGVSLLGSGDYVIDTAVNTGNILYVAITGSDTDTTRAGHIGNLAKPFLTLEAARDAALSGDNIYVFAGTYTATTTATNGLAKDGVNYFFEAGAIVNKASAGDMFNDTGFTIGCNVFGKGTFNKTGSAGDIFKLTNTQSTYNYIIEYAEMLNTVGYCILRNTGGSVPIFLIKGDYAESTANVCFHITNASQIRIEGGRGVRSTVGYAIRYGIASQAMYISGTQITTTVGGYSIYQEVANSQNTTIDCTYATGITSAGVTSVSGEVGNVYSAVGRISVNGRVRVFLGGDSGSAIIDSCTQISSVSSFSGTLVVNNLYQDNSYTVNTGHIFAGTGSYIINGISRGGTNLTGNYYWFRMTETPRVIFNVKYTTAVNFLNQCIVSGGELVFEDGFTIHATQTSVLTPIKQTGGKIVLKGSCVNLINSSVAAVIDKQGGTLILENASLKTANAEVPPIIATISPQNIHVQYNMGSNRTENGGTLAAKKQKNKFTVNAVATTTVTINGTAITETDTTTYNTTALMAQRMRDLINANGTLNVVVVASQDTLGTDTYFYVEALVGGTPFTIGTLANLTNAVTRLNSYALTNVTGGLIIDNANVE